MPKKWKLDVERNVAAEFLRSMAPTQTHENRKEFIKAAEMLEGIDMRPKHGEITYDTNMVALSLPIRWGPKRLLGYLSVFITAGATDQTDLGVRWHDENGTSVEWRPEVSSSSQPKEQDTTASWKEAVRRRNEALMEIIKFHDDYAEASGRQRYTIPQAVNKARKLLTEDF